LYRGREAGDVSDSWAQIRRRRSPEICRRHRRAPYHTRHPPLSPPWTGAHLSRAHLSICWRRLFVKTPSRRRVVPTRDVQRSIEYTRVIDYLNNRSTSRKISLSKARKVSLFGIAKKGELSGFRRCPPSLWSRVYVTVGCLYVCLSVCLVDRQQQRLAAGLLLSAAAAAESYTVIICQQSYLLLFGIPSPTQSFIPGLNLFRKSFPPQPFLFLLHDSLHGFPRLFTVIS